MKEVYSIVSELLIPGSKLINLSFETLDQIKAQADLFKVTPSMLITNLHYAGLLADDKADLFRALLAIELKNRGKQSMRSPKPTTAYRKYNGVRLSTEVVRAYRKGTLSQDQMQGIPFKTGKVNDGIFKEYQSFQMTMIRYLLDTNVVISDLKRNTKPRSDFFVLEDVYEECAVNEERIGVLKKAGVQVLPLRTRHYHRLAKVMEKHGGNTKLIRLFTSKGTADVLMLAFVLEEHEFPEFVLFPPEYIIVTKDDALQRAAGSYGLRWVSELP